MPGVGAGATYKRMRCGVDAAFYSLPANIGANVLGINGQDVTAVLAGAQGALELLPSRHYGMQWLEFMEGHSVLKSWPETCPYEEIYKAIGKWYGLFKTDWINPANLRNCGVTETLGLLDKAKKFHEQIAGLYHENSYAHYGADADRKAWRKVVWKVDSAKELREIESLIIVEDDRKGELRLRETLINSADPVPAGAAT